MNKENKGVIHHNGKEYKVKPETDGGELIERGRNAGLKTRVKPLTDEELIERGRNAGLKIRIK